MPASRRREKLLRRFGPADRRRGAARWTFRTRSACERVLDSSPACDMAPSPGDLLIVLCDEHGRRRSPTKIETRRICEVRSVSAHRSVVCGVIETLLVHKKPSHASGALPGVARVERMARPEKPAARGTLLGALSTSRLFPTGSGRRPAGQEFEVLATLHRLRSGPIWAVTPTSGISAEFTPNRRQRCPNSASVWVNPSAGRRSVVSARGGGVDGTCDAGRAWACRPRGRWSAMWGE